MPVESKSSGEANSPLQPPARPSNQPAVGDGEDGRGGCRRFRSSMVVSDAERREREGDGEVLPKHSTAGVSFGNLPWRRPIFRETDGFYRSGGSLWRNSLQEILLCGGWAFKRL